VPIDTLFAPSRPPELRGAAVCPGVWSAAEPQETRTMWRAIDNPAAGPGGCGDGRRAVPVIRFAGVKESACATVGARRESISLRVSSDLRRLGATSARAPRYVGG
jgi:hypothetical protein